MNIKLEIGKELKGMLDANLDINKIARWADNIYANYCREINDHLDDILFSLSALTLGEEFVLTKEKLYQIALDLISEGEEEDLSLDDGSSQKAIVIEKDWFMCPLCQEVWNVNNLHKMIRCPKCNNKLYNPLFSSEKK